MGVEKHATLGAQHRPTFSIPASRLLLLLMSTVIDALGAATRQAEATFGSELDTRSEEPPFVDGLPNPPLWPGAPTIQAPLLPPTELGSEFYEFPPPYERYYEYVQSPPSFVDANPDPPASTADTTPSMPPGNPDIPSQPPSWPGFPMPPESPAPSPRPLLLGPPKLRLYGSDTAGTGGIVQAYDYATESWGALCVPRYQFVRRRWEPMNADAEVAQLVCRQLGLPWRAAYLTPADRFAPRNVLQHMNGLLLGEFSGLMCPNAKEVETIFDCSYVRVLYHVADNCMDAFRQAYEQGFSRRQFPRNYMPVAVRCKGEAPPPPPPPAPRPPPASFPTVTYQMRIVNPRTSSEYHSNGSRVTTGRVEVLLQGPEDVEPIWGTICNSFPSDEVAKYACKTSGLPWRAAYARGWPLLHRSLIPQPPPPVHFVHMERCSLVAGAGDGEGESSGLDDGLACELALSPVEATMLVQSLGGRLRQQNQQKRVHRRQQQRLEQQEQVVVVQLLEEQQQQQPGLKEEGQQQQEVEEQQQQQSEGQLQGEDEALEEEQLQPLISGEQELLLTLRRALNYCNTNKGRGHQADLIAVCQGPP